MKTIPLCPSRTRSCLPLPGLLLLMACLPAQDWAPVTTSVAMSGMNASYDSFRERVVTVDASGRAFERDDRQWFPIGTLPENSLALLAYQAHRGRTLALLNPTSAATLSTYEYDGGSWRLRNPDHTPPLRSGMLMTYDSGRRRAVVFAGNDQSGLGETWEWDGTDWLRRLPAVAPPTRGEGTMAFDPVRGVTVLFGGVAAGVLLDDHWEWDGINWSRRTLPIVPSARRQAQLAFDASRNLMVLYGGRGPLNGQPFFDPQPWEFDGVQWVARNIATAPEGRTGHAAVGIGNGVLVLGGGTSLLAGDQRPTIYHYDGARFVEQSGAVLVDLSLALDPVRGRTVLAGWQSTGLTTGMPRTFEWDGLSLAELTVAGPTPGRGIVLADRLGNGVVGFVPDGTTWTFDGTAWQQRASTGPSPRLAAAMATDSTRGVVVMFGGTDLLGATFDDTWEWNGTAWNQRPVTGPAARWGSGIAFDPVNARCVMHGGVDVTQATLSDTWSYTATGWTLIDNTALPLATSAMAWSAELGTVVLTRTQLMGTSTTLKLGNNNLWLPITGAESAVPTYRLATDPQGHVVSSGGADGRAISVLGWTPGRAEFEGAGCSNAGPPSRLALHDRPRPGNVLRPELLGAESNQLVLVTASHVFARGSFGSCPTHLYQPALLAVGTTNAVGQFRLPITVPATAAMRGVALGLQAVVGELGGPVFGSFGFSDAMRITIGD
ncbi:MAG: hypothetical protein KDC98_02230 [Planctomycetes bacterium]|nr:hypothetical protein [Planctomycetota bacterium]